MAPPLEPNRRRYKKYLSRCSYSCLFASLKLTIAAISIGKKSPFVNWQSLFWHFFVTKVTSFDTEGDWQPCTTVPLISISFRISRYFRRKCLANYKESLRIFFFKFLFQSRPNWKLEGNIKKNGKMLSFCFKTQTPYAVWGKKKFDYILWRIFRLYAWSLLHVLWKIFPANQLPLAPRTLHY